MKVSNTSVSAQFGSEATPRDWHFYRNNVPFFIVRDKFGEDLPINLMRRWTGEEWEYRTATDEEVSDWAARDAW